MKKLLTTNITSTAQMPIRKMTLDHLQTAYTELINAITGSLIGITYGNIGQIAVIGSANTTPGGATYTIDPGFIMFNGALYETVGGVVNTVGPQTCVASIATTYATGDPTEFTNAASYNIHEIKKIAFSAGLPGTGVFDYDDMTFVKVTPDCVGSTTGVAYGTGYDDGGLGERVYYAKNRDALVTINGVAYADGTPSMADPIFTLPAALWPSTKRTAPCIVSTGGGFYTAILSVDTNGDVTALSTDPIFTTPVQWLNDTAIFIAISYYR